MLTVSDITYAGLGATTNSLIKGRDHQEKKKNSETDSGRRGRTIKRERKKREAVVRFRF